MDSGRVGACHKLENKRRRYLMVVNDVVKSRYDVLAEYLDHAHDESAHNFEKSKAFVRRALVRQKVLQKCMKMRRQNVGNQNMYGRYGGKPIDAFSRDIESFIAFNHPKKRRKRYLQKLMDDSLDTGAILKEDIAQERVQSWMERSYTKYKLMKAKREQSIVKSIPEEKPKSLPKRQGAQLRLPPVMRSSYNTETDVETKISQDKDLFTITESVERLDLESKPDTEVLESKQKVSHVTDTRPTIKLPPINPTRSMVAT